MSIQIRRIALVLVLVGSLLSGGRTPVSAERAGAPDGTSTRDVAKRLAAGGAFTCLLGTDGTVRCWGKNDEGQIGNGDTSLNPALSPTLVSGITNAVEITAGFAHACALLNDKTMKCWGRGADGQLGDGLTAQSATPVVVSNPAGTGPLSDIRTIGAGSEHTCAVRDNDGAVFCWGDEILGHLGNGETSVLQSRPVQVKTDESTNLTGIRELAVGPATTCGLNASGAALCWGSNAYSQLAIDKSVAAFKAYATAWGAATGLVGIDVGGQHICGFTTGALSCAGGNTGDYAFSQMLQKNSIWLTPESSLRHLVLADAATCYVNSSSKLTCAGGLFAGSKRNVWADGDGATGYFDTSLLVTDVRAITAGSDHFCAYFDTKIKCWGANASGQLGGGSVSSYSSFTTVVAAVSGTLALSDPGPQEVSVGSFSVAGTTNSGAPITYDVDASSDGVCSVASDGTVTVLGAGSCVINASVAAIGLFTSASSSRTITISALAPTVSAVDATGIGFSTAVLAASVNPRGASALVKVTYGVSETLADGTDVSIGALNGLAAAAQSTTLSSLRPGTTYFYRFTATNSIGVTQSDIKSFATTGAKPVVVTGSSTRSTSGMTVNGRVNPKELETSVRFEYGTDAKLAEAKQTAAKTQTGADDIDVSAAITGLAENTTYYYRIVASNAVGTSEGEIKSFTTTRPEGVSINDGDEFTSSENVTVSVVGPSTAVKAILSNDGGFKTSETFDLINNSADIPWKLQSSREGTFTKIVYVKYVTRFGSQIQAVTDDIILDTTKPVMSAATAVAAAPSGSAVQVARVGVSAAKKASGGVRLSLKGSDTISGIGSIEIRSSASKAVTTVKVSRLTGKTDGKPRAASQTVSLKTKAKRLQIRVIDRAGNASAWRTIPVR